MLRACVVSAVPCFLSRVQALVVLEYLVKAGSQRVVAQCKDNIFSVETLKDFQFMDKDGKDQGTAGNSHSVSLLTFLYVNFIVLPRLAVRESLP